MIIIIMAIIILVSILLYATGVYFANRLNKIDEINAKLRRIDLFEDGLLEYLGAVKDYSLYPVLIKLRNARDKTDKLKVLLDYLGLEIQEIPPVSEDERFKIVKKSVKEKDNKW